MAQFEAYLNFNGNCAEAMRFYERTFGGKLEMMTHGESPMAAQASPGAKDRIMHARLAIEGGVLMASDTMPEHPFEGMKGFALSLSYPTMAAAQKIFDVLAQGGQVQMPLQKTFWAEGFGMLVDRFGTPWMVNAGHSA